MNKNLQNEKLLTKQEIEKDFLDKVLDANPTSHKYLKLAKLHIPGVIQWLDEQRRNFPNKFWKNSEIRKILNMEWIDDFTFRKMIQAYRENANMDDFTKPKYKYSTMEKYSDHIQFYGMIIANAKGYKFSRDETEIENYMKTTEGRRISAVKQGLSADILLADLRNNQNKKVEYQNHKPEGRN